MAQIMDRKLVKTSVGRVTLTLSGTNGVTVPRGSVVSKAGDQTIRYATLADATFAGGTATVDAESIRFGTVTAGQLTVVEEPTKSRNDPASKVALTGTNGSTVPRETVFSVFGDPTKRFVTLAEVVIGPAGGFPSGTAEVDVESEAAGVTAGIGTLTVIATPVTGLTSVTNPGVLGGWASVTNPAGLSETFEVDDLAYVNGDLARVEDAECLGQRLRVKLRTFLGEYFLDSAWGVPYREEVLVKGADLDEVDAVFKDQILSTPDVVALESFDFDFDPSGRELDVKFEAQTTFGPVTVQA